MPEKVVASLCRSPSNVQAFDFSVFCFLYTIALFYSYKLDSSMLDGSARDGTSVSTIKQRRPTCDQLPNTSDARLSSVVIVSDTTGSLMTWGHGTPA